MITKVNLTLAETSRSQKIGPCKPGATAALAGVVMSGLAACTSNASSSADIAATSDNSEQPVVRQLDFHASPSANGKELVYYSYGAEAFPDVFILNLETGKSRNLTRSEDLWEIEPEWSPAGRIVAFARGPKMSKLHVISHNLDTGEEIDFGPGINPSWSKDGAQITWMKDWRIKIAGADGANARFLDLSHLDGEKSEPVWGHDGTYLTFSVKLNGADQIDLHKIDLASGETTQLTNTPYSETGTQYSPDGKHIYFNAGSIPQIYRMNSDGQDIQGVYPPEPDKQHYFPALSKDGETLFYESGNWSADTFFLYSIDVDSDDAKPVQLTRR